MNRHTAWIAVVTLLAGFLLMPLGCRSRSNISPGQGAIGPVSAGHEQATAKRGPQFSRIHAEPAVRIRLKRSVDAVSLSAGTPLTIGPGQGDRGRAQPRQFTGPVTIRRISSGYTITDARGQTQQWGLGSLRISVSNGRLSIGGSAYPGAVELIALDAASLRFDVINHVGMEDYLPGVLSKELYASWHPEAYRAQAIAARSYAIWEMNLPRRRAGHFDLEAGQASQAYTANVSEKARQAVDATRGQVLVFEGRVLPAFYSSSTGGVGQDAVAAFPGRVDDLAPLRGRAHGQWGQTASKYRWGPIVRSRDTLSRRLASWGQATDHTIAGLGTIVAIQVASRNSAGRPTAYFVDDDRRLRYTIAAEHFRQGANFTSTLAGGAVPAADKLYSSNLGITITGNQVRFTGQGYGHGVGMGQWGAQEMAQAGYAHGSILGFYYPGAALRQAY